MCRDLYVCESSLTSLYLPGVQTTPPQATGYPSLQAQLASSELNHPVTVLPKRGTPPTSPQLAPTFQPLSQQLPCEIHLVNLRSLQHAGANRDLEYVPQEEVALILHTFATDCSLPSRGLTCPANNGQVRALTMYSHDTS